MTATRDGLTSLDVSSRLDEAHARVCNAAEMLVASNSRMTTSDGAVVSGTRLRDLAESLAVLARARAEWRRSR